MVVSADTTATDQVTANPDGSFTLNAASAPVRTLQNGTWVAIDPTLSFTGVGTVAPAATTNPMTFSGGGVGALATISAGSDSISVAWPSPLPVPTLSGPTATYANVFPGVDLAVTALSDSFSEALVVHSAAAAANPALTDPQFSITATNVNLATSAGGGLLGTDSSGQAILSSSQPVMWDSTNNPGLGPAPTLTNPGSGNVTALTASMPTAEGAQAPGTATSVLSLSVPRTALAGSSVTYPVYIDPNITGNSIVVMAQVFSNGAPYYNGANNQYFKVGDCDWPGCNGIGVGRSYFSFDTSQLEQGSWPSTAHIYGASVTATELWNANGCTAEDVNLDTVTPEQEPTNSTTWPGPIGGLLDTEPSAAGGGANCPQGAVTFANSSVDGWIQDAATYSWAVTGFTLAAYNENDPDDWKQFYSEQKTNPPVVPQLNVNYAFAPSAPLQNIISGKISCPGYPLYAVDTAPEIEAKSDKNPNAGNLNLGYEIYDYPTYGTLEASSNPVHTVASDVNDTWTSSNLSNGNYALRTQSSTLPGLTPILYSPYSGWTDFTIDTTAPPTPSISSFTDPQNYWGAPAGAGTLSVAAPGAVGVSYSFTGSGDENVPSDSWCPGDAVAGIVTASNGAATIPTSRLSVGENTLYVRSFTAAHVFSSEQSYSFYVPPSYSGEGSTLLEAEQFGNGLANTSITQPAGQNDCYYVEGPYGIWSGQEAQHFMSLKSGNGIGEALQFNFKTQNLEADYALGVNLTTVTHFGNLDFQLTGGGLPKTTLAVNDQTVEFTGNGPTRTEYVELGGAHLLANTNYTITVTFTGTSATADYVSNYTCSNGQTLNKYDDNGYSASIDYFTIVPINNATYASFSSAMNNHGLVSDGGTAGPGFDLRNYNRSETAMRQVGFGAGQTVTVDSATPTQATFTMPQANTNGYDNIIADGQTIDLPTPVAASHIDLLVASTCGSTPTSVSSSTLQFTLNYASGLFKQVPLQPIEVWTNGQSNVTDTPTNQETVTRAERFAYLDVGNVRDDDNVTPFIYHVYIKLQPGSPIASITLPYLGTNFVSPDGNSCAAFDNATLHVLAMSTGS